jgi:hypothetical protein
MVMDKARVMQKLEWNGTILVHRIMIMVRVYYTNKATILDTRLKTPYIATIDREAITTSKLTTTTTRTTTITTDFSFFEIRMTYNRINKRVFIKELWGFD